MPTPTPTPRRRRVILRVIAATIVALLASAAVVQQRAAASWAAMEQCAAAMQSAFDQRDHRREPLWGEGDDGSAFAAYARAVALAQPLDHEEVTPRELGTDARVATETADLRARWRPALEAMRAGAHSTDVRPPRIRPDDPKAGIASLLYTRSITNAAVCEARALRHAGHHRQAVEWTLDAATFGADHVCGGVMINQMIGIACVAIAMHGAWPDEALQQLDPEALTVLAAGLDQLDARLPTRLDFTAELLWLADWLRHSPIEKDYDIGAATAWRFGFSTRWMTADAFAHYAATMERLADAPPRLWPEHQAVMETEIAALTNSHNPMLQLIAPNLTAPESNFRHTLAHVRLLRAAVGVLRGEDVSGLRDPFGSGTLSVVEEADGKRFRSVSVPDGRPIERFVRRR